jgi:hypothetical protein
VASAPTCDNREPHFPWSTPGPWLSSASLPRSRLAESQPGSHAAIATKVGQRSYHGARRRDQQGGHQQEQDQHHDLVNNVSNTPGH